MSQAPLYGLSEAERTLAFQRFELLRPSLEGGGPLARVARDRGLALRTAQRCAGQYPCEGLAGLARKGRSDRGKRHRRGHTDEVHAVVFSPDGYCIASAGADFASTLPGSRGLGPLAQMPPAWLMAAKTFFALVRVAASPL